LSRANPSCPSHRVLEPDPYAKAHLIAAEGEGALAVLSLLGQAPSGFAGCSTILYAAQGTVAGLRLTGHPHADNLLLFSDIPALLLEWERLLREATMGTSIYAAGREIFIGEVVRSAVRYGVSAGACQTEVRGSVSRRVQCIHCKHMNDGVATETVTCSQCGIRLQVRDHYSRRLNAFMGVAEVPVMSPRGREPNA
jgi:dimethylamine monooxygenase subunit C